MITLWQHVADPVAERYEAVVEEIERQRRFTRPSLTAVLQPAMPYAYSSINAVVRELRSRGLVRLVSAPDVRPQTFVVT